MTVKMQFPTGLAFFTDKNGAKQTPDALGQIDIASDDMGYYMLAGFFPVAYLDVIDAIQVVDAADAVETALMKKALAGDMIFVVTPATLTRKATAAAWTRTVAIALQTAAGENHTWFNKAITSGVSIADTSTAGTATIPSTVLTFVAGLASVVVSGDAAAWLAAETNTLTAAAATLLGYVVATKTSVETIN